MLKTIRIKKSKWREGAISVLCDIVLSCILLLRLYPEWTLVWPIH